MSLMIVVGKEGLYIVQGPDQKRKILLSVQKSVGGLMVNICMARDQGRESPQVSDMERLECAGKER
jgi:hypothetical protein